jgi:hypothetical protein
MSQLFNHQIAGSNRVDSSEGLATLLGKITSMIKKPAGKKISRDLDKFLKKGQKQ